jgi:hypothetical protein
MTAQREKKGNYSPSVFDPFTVGATSVEDDIKTAVEFEHIFVAKHSTNSAGKTDASGGDR